MSTSTFTQVNADLAEKGDGLVPHFEEALARSAQLGHPIVVSYVKKSSVDLTRDHLLGLYNDAQIKGLPRAFWLTPDPFVALVAIGEITHIEGSGSSRFHDVRKQHDKLLQGHTIIHDSHQPVKPPQEITGPVVIGGFSFHESAQADDNQLRDAAIDSVWQDFPAALLTLPEILYTQTKAGLWVTLNVQVSPESDVSELVIRVQRLLAHARQSLNTAPRLAPSLHGASHKVTADGYDADQAEQAWDSIVEAAVNTINSQELKKVVVSRDMDVKGELPFSPSAALSVLGEMYPECFLYAFTRGERTFVGATPERLAAIVDGTARITCLAGSAPRGSTPAEDQSIGEALLEDPKNLFEHRLVIDMVMETLTPLLDSLTVAPHPVLLKLKNVQHLYTPVTGSASDTRSDVDILKLVEALHPTPAVGGYPKEVATDWLLRHETFERGWYTGPIGWMGPAGDGEFAVALRSAVVSRDRAKLFAGCGIVSASEKQAEFAESTLKLAPMLHALERSQT